MKAASITVIWHIAQVKIKLLGRAVEKGILFKKRKHFLRNENIKQHFSASSLTKALR
jgi:hypothetical protein